MKNTTTPVTKCDRWVCPIPLAEKLAKLLARMEFQEWRGHQARARLKLALTHEEIAQMIGTSRETVTRSICGSEEAQIVQSKGSTLVILQQGCPSPSSYEWLISSRMDRVPRVTVGVTAVTVFSPAAA